MAEQQQGGRNPKRPRVEADKRRDALLHVQDEYADIDFTKYQKLVGAGAACVATDGAGYGVLVTCLQGSRCDALAPTFGSHSQKC